MGRNTRRFIPTGNTTMTTSRSLWLDNGEFTHGIEVSPVEDGQTILPSQARLVSKPSRRVAATIRREELAELRSLQARPWANRALPNARKTNTRGSTRYATDSAIFTNPVSAAEWTGSGDLGLCKRRSLRRRTDNSPQPARNEPQLKSRGRTIVLPLSHLTCRREALLRTWMRGLTHSSRLLAKSPLLETMIGNRWKTARGTARQRQWTRPNKPALNRQRRRASAPIGAMRDWQKLKCNLP